MSGTPVRVGIAGAAGRMGRTLVALVDDTDGLVLGAALERAGHELESADAGVVAGRAACGVALSSDVRAALAEIDVLVDFTTPAATMEHLDACLEMRCAAVVGTTGLGADERARIEVIATSIPLVVAPNMSVGVTVCLDLIERAARAFADDFDVEVIEAHHRHKVDAPSGTAVRIGEVLAGALGRDLERDAIYGRQGMTGARKRDTIGFATVRGGDIVGEHTVMFAGEGERIEITHRAASRDNFARGALRAAGWVIGRTPGCYDMRDVLGLG